MANFVLVHGAWSGGWCYRETAQALRHAGHHVFTPTHTGSGERFHQSNEGITLETHIRDVCGCIESEELSDVILVGHSYGGMVITGVADRMSHKMRTLVYLDAFVPEHGESLIALVQKALSPDEAAQYLGAYRDDALKGHGGMIQPMPAEAFNTVPAHRARVDRLSRPQSLATFEMPVLLTGAIDSIKNRLYILADGWDANLFRYFAASVEGRPDWRVVSLPAGHAVMIDVPGQLANELLQLV